LIQAKAAISAGIKTLLEVAECSLSSISHISIAGGLGAHLNLQSARVIGLLPPVDPSKYHVIGNGSLTGASMCMLDPDFISIAETIVNQSTVIELNQTPGFCDHYIDSMCVGWEH